MAKAKPKAKTTKGAARKKVAPKKPAPKKAAAKGTAKKDYKVSLERSEPRGLFGHIWEARRGLRASLEAQLRQGISEERLLAYVAFACLMAFVARLPTVMSVRAESLGQINLPGLVAGSFVAFVILAPLFLYGLAAISHLISLWAFGGEGTYQTSRLALFWSLVLAVPIGLIWAIVVQSLTLLEMEAVIGPLGLGVFLIWLWIWASFIAISEGFDRFRCFFFIIGLMLGIGGLAMFAT